jgi:hypothetical protein
MPACPFCRRVLTHELDIDKGCCVECRLAIWLILFEECGASTGDVRDQFLHHFPRCREFRFMGSLGFGGKVHWSGGRLYVTCYAENYTPERRDAMQRANDRLHALVKET